MSNFGIDSQKQNKKNGIKLHPICAHTYTTHTYMYIDTYFTELMMESALIPTFVSSYHQYTDSHTYIQGKTNYRNDMPLQNVLFFALVILFVLVNQFCVPFFHHHFIYIYLYMWLFYFIFPLKVGELCGRPIVKIERRNKEQSSQLPAKLH